MEIEGKCVLGSEIELWRGWQSRAYLGHREFEETLDLRGVHARRSAYTEPHRKSPFCVLIDTGGDRSYSLTVYRCPTSACPQQQGCAVPR